jgi:hypothetical protein
MQSEHNSPRTELTHRLDNWIAATPIPKRTLESRETQLAGEEHILRINLARKMLCWLPEERSSAGELLKDEFLNS